MPKEQEENEYWEVTNIDYKKVSSKDINVRDMETNNIKLRR